MRCAAAIALCLMVWGCGSDSDEKLAGFEVRQLLPTEKEALRRSLSQALREPDAAQFKWMPLVVQRSKATGYCGLIDAKGSPGPSVGFRKFAATIQQGSGGQYDHGVIEHVEGSPAIFGSAGPAGDTAGRGTAEEVCKAWGYVDFSLAN